MDIASLTREQAQLNGQIKMYMGRVETVLTAAPASTATQAAGRDLAKAKYMDLDKNLQKSEIAKSMEDRKQGETLELLDSPSLPLECGAAEPPHDHFDRRGAGPASCESESRRHKA